MSGLIVNIDHIATLRETRQSLYPDPISAALLAELSGADGIVVHLYHDRHHIQDRDVRLLRQTVQSRLILKMAATPEMVGFALDVQPDSVILVPEKREEASDNGGFDLVIHKNTVAETIDSLQASGIPVSLYIDPDPDQIRMAHRISAGGVQIQTGIFCHETAPAQKQIAFSQIVIAVKLARKLKLRITAGGGLSYQTIKAFHALSEIDEFCIGHSIVSKAILTGMEKAVRDMNRLIRESKQ